MQTKTAILIMFLLTCLPDGDEICRAEDANRHPQIVWRDSLHAGVNALFLYLRSLDRSVSYFELIEPHRALPVSVADIVNLSQLTAFRCKARRISPVDLKEMSLPLIVHVDGDNPDLGSFLLVTHIGDRVRYFECASMLLSDLNYESFLRQWSGVVIVEDRDNKINARIYWLAFLGFGLAFSIRQIPIMCLRAISYKGGTS